MSGSMHRMIASLLPIAACLATLGAVQAQTNYPDKPVRLVVGFSAGGPTDLPARFIADRLGSAVGQRVIVENRTGAGGQIATQDVLGRPRDGYNLLLCTHFESINAAIYKKVAYKLGDIAPISQISRYYYGIALSAAVIPGSTLYLFSDGLFEIETAQGEQRELEDFVPLLLAPAAGASSEPERLVGEVRRLTGRSVFEDDLTVLVATFP